VQIIGVTQDQFATIICSGRRARIVRVVDHLPGTHPWSPIHDRLTAREWVATHGSRWSAVNPDGTATYLPLFHGPTPGYDGSHDLGLAYSVTWSEES
jgi:hypothetical protein